MSFLSELAKDVKVHVSNFSVHNL